MRALIGMVADRLRNSYWFVPSLMCLLAVVLALLTLWVDQRHPVEGAATGWWGRLLFTGSVSGARSVLTTVAGSSMTVAGVVFSITMVALTLASQQYGSRLLANFMRDRGTQATLGTFLATFLYSLVVLRAIHGAGRSHVPHVAVTLDLILAIGGVSMLIYFVHHVASRIQSPNLAQVVAHEFRQALDHAYEETEPEETAVPEFDTRGAARVPARQRGYLQLVDYAGLLDVATDADLQIRVEQRPGRFLVPSSVVAHAWPADRVDEQVARRIARHVTSGARRTPQQDVEFPARQLTEMAVRALSPGINDVVTATICIDHLSDALCEAAARTLERRVLRDEEGRVRVWSGDPMDFADLVASYDGIRESAGFHATVYLRALDALSRVLPCLDREDRVAAVLRQARLLAEAAEREVAAEDDREPIRHRYTELREQARTRAPRPA